MATIDIVFPAAHEARNGIADHTGHLARGLMSRGNEVRVIAAGPPAESSQAGSIDGWPDGDLRHTADLLAAVAMREPQVVIVQFEQFAYGARGRNGPFSRFFEQLRRDSPGVRRVLFVHETYTTPRTAKRAVMRVYQKAQFRRLVRSADSVLVTCDEWRERVLSLGIVSTVVPVPSAIPRVDVSQTQARSSLGIGNGLVVAVFGYLDRDRAEYVGAALVALEDLGATVIYVGKDGDPFRACASRVQLAQIVIDDASEEQVSTALIASDMALAPYPDGASARRSSLMTILDHRVPAVTTQGANRDGLVESLIDVGALVASKGGLDDFAQAASTLARNPQSRAAMRVALADGVDLLPTWEGVLLAVEAALHR